MYKLFWSPGSASALPHAVLEETGAPYELHLVDTSKGQNKEQRYLALNPSGKVPALGLPNGTVISECAAIAIYIADQYPDAQLAPALNDPKRGSYYQWMMYLTNTLQANAMRFYYPERNTVNEIGKDQIAQKAAEDVATNWARIENELAKANHPYILGDQYSTPDIFIYMLSTWQESCPHLYDRFPSVKKLADLVGSRRAIQKMMKANQA